jgi:hypothetical protein
MASAVSLACASQVSQQGTGFTASFSCLIGWRFNLKWAK